VVGFDLFVDRDLKVWVLEVNDSPSLNINLCLEGDKGLIKHASEVDRVIKTTVVGDAIELMRNYREGLLYKCWQRLPVIEDCSVVMQAKAVFEKLIGKSSKQTG
jgi:hypothetical protein